MANIQRGFIATGGNHAPKPPFVLNKDSPQAQGLVGWYPLAGGPARDFSGYGRHQTAQTGTQTDAPGPYGNIVKDFADDGEITTAHVGQLDGVANATLCCWAVWQDTRGAYDHFLAHYGSDTNRFTLMIGGPGVGDTANTALNVGNGSNTFTYASNDIPNQNEAYFIAAAFDGAQATADDRANIYTNAVLQGKTVSGTLPTALGTHSGAFTLGTDPGNATRDHGGLIWDTRIYNRTLSAAEIWALYEPSSRWDLYYELGRVLYFLPPVVGAVALGHGLLLSRERNKLVIN